MTIRTVLISAAVTALVAGCGGGAGSGDANVTVRGTVAPTARHLDNARAIATGADHKTYWSYLDARGSFALTLPAGQAYRVVIANATVGRGHRAVGHLVATGTAKGRSAWIALRGRDVSLGALHLHGQASKGTRSTLVEKNEMQGTNQDQQGTVEENVDDLCGEHVNVFDDEDNDVALEAEKSGDIAGTESNNPHANDDDELPNCVPAAPPAAGTPPAPPAGGGAPGSPCDVTASCAAGLSCIGGTCGVPR